MGPQAVALSTLLLLWMTLLVAGSVVAGTGGRVRPTTKLPIDFSTLHPYELAYLTAGPERAAETVLAALLDREVLQSTSDRRLWVAAVLQHADPLESAAARLVGERHRDSDASIGTVARRLASGDAMAELRRRLRAKGAVMGRVGTAIAAGRLYGTLLLSVRCLVGPITLSVASWLRYDSDAYSPGPPPGPGMIFVPFAVLVGIGGLHTYRRCGHLLRAGLGHRTRNLVATARANRAAKSAGVERDGDAEDPAGLLIDVALNGSAEALPGMVGQPTGQRSRSNSDDQYNGGVLRFVGRSSGGSRFSSSSEYQD